MDKLKIQQTMMKIKNPENILPPGFCSVNTMTN